MKYAIELANTAFVLYYMAGHLYETYAFVVVLYFLSYIHLQACFPYSIDQMFCIILYFGEIMGNEAIFVRIIPVFEMSG